MVARGVGSCSRKLEARGTGRGRRKRPNPTSSSTPAPTDGLGLRLMRIGRPRGSPLQYTLTWKIGNLVLYGRPWRSPWHYSRLPWHSFTDPEEFVLLSLTISSRAGIMQ